MKNLLLLSLLFTLSTASAAQHEIKSLSEIDSFVDANTLVVFDIDNTLAESSQTIGSVQWQEHELQKAKKLGLPQEKAFERSLRKFIAVNYVSSMRPVEITTPRDVMVFQYRGAKVMALTARPAELHARTTNLLLNIGIDLGNSNSSPLSERVSVIKNEEAVFDHGIFAVGGTNDKGEMLKWLMAQPGFAKFTKVVFVDDKEKYVISIEKALTDSEFQHDSFRYGAADARVKSFDAVVADRQTDWFESTGKIMTDAEATQLNEDYAEGADH